MAPICDAALALSERPFCSSTSASLCCARSTCGAATPVTVSLSLLKNERNRAETPYLLSASIALSSVVAPTE